MKPSKRLRLSLRELERQKRLLRTSTFTLPTIQPSPVIQPKVETVEQLIDINRRGRLIMIPFSVWIRSQPGSTKRGCRRNRFLFPRYVTREYVSAEPRGTLKGRRFGHIV